MNPHQYSVSFRKKRFVSAKRTFRRRMFNRKVRAVVRQSSERKFAQINIPVLVNNVAANQLGPDRRHLRQIVVSVPQGTGRSTRIGNKITLRYIYLNLQFVFQEFANTFLPIRVQLLTNKMHSSTELLTGIDTGNGVDYYRTKTLPDTAISVMDQYITIGVTANASPCFTIKKYVRIHETVQFDNNQALTPSNKNFVLLISAYALTGNGGSRVDVTGYTSVGFIDA